MHTHVCVVVSCKNFSTKVCVRNLQDFHLQSLASNLQDFHLVRYLVQETCKISSCKIADARNLQDFHLVRYLVQETCKIFILQDGKCKKCARFWSCKITGARNVHDSWLARSAVQETCTSCQKCARRCKIFLHGRECYRLLAAPSLASTQCTCIPSSLCCVRNKVS